MEGKEEKEGKMGGSVAQWLRGWTCNSNVVSSIPGRGAVK